MSLFTFSDFLNSHILEISNVTWSIKYGNQVKLHFFPNDIVFLAHNVCSWAKKLNYFVSFQVFIWARILAQKLKAPETCKMDKFLDSKNRQNMSESWTRNTMPWKLTKCVNFRGQKLTLFVSFWLLFFFPIERISAQELNKHNKMKLTDFWIFQKFQD